MSRFTHLSMIIIAAVAVGCTEGQLVAGGDQVDLPSKPDYLGPPGGGLGEIPPEPGLGGERAPAPAPEEVVPGPEGERAPNPGGERENQPAPEGSPAPEGERAPAPSPEGRPPQPDAPPEPDGRAPAPEPEGRAPAPEPEGEGAPRPDAPPEPDGRAPAPEPGGRAPAPNPEGERAPAPEPQANEDDGCTDAEHAGECEGDVAVWCDDGRTARFDCRAKLGAGCGRVDEATGFFCVADAPAPNGGGDPQPAPVPPENGAPEPDDQSDPEGGEEPEQAPEVESEPESECGDLTYLGQCEGDVARWCDRQGRVQTLDCGAQDQFCAYVNDETGYYCTNEAPPAPEPEAQQPENGCGALDYLGECNGTVARWCSNGEINSLDCGARGQACGYVDDTTGYYCQDGAPESQEPEPEPEPAPVPEPEQDPEPEAAPDGCDGVDFQGYCVGDIVHYCSGGQLLTPDCSTQNQTCGWVNDEVGNDCVEGD